MAAGGILRRILAEPSAADVIPNATAGPAPSIAAAVATRGRGDARGADGSTTGRLADRVAAATVGGLTVEGERAYLGLLSDVLEDRRLSDTEVVRLSEASSRFAIGPEDAQRLHEEFLRRTRSLALADGSISRAEQSDLDLLADLLGVSLRSVATSEVPGLPARSEAVSISDDWAGKSVCFTGDSVCSVRGVKLSREDQERLAVQHGLVIRSGVSARLDLLVLADPDSRSGKARRAEELGVRRIVERDFWRRLGVGID